MAAVDDPRIPRSGDRVINLSVLIGGIIAVFSPFLEGVIKWVDWRLGDWVNFSPQYQAVVENMSETALLFLAGQWLMRRIRRQDIDLAISERIDQATVQATVRSRGMFDDAPDAPAR